MTSDVVVRRDTFAGAATPSGSRLMPMRSRAYRFLALALLLLPACGRTEERSSCGTVEERARALRDEITACTAGDECQAVPAESLTGHGTCLISFQCVLLLRKGVDLMSLRDRVAALSAEQNLCGPCVVADCTANGDKVPACNPTSGRCELRDP